MRVILWLDSDRPWNDLQELAWQAEQAGWDGVRVGGGPTGAECWAVVGGLATVVPRIRLDAVVRDDAGRHPAVVAKLASTADQLSGGRLLLGLVPGPDGESRLAEVVTVVKHLAGRERTTLDGAFFQLRDAPLDPKPLRQPFPVMLVGGSPELAAQSADHWSIPNDEDLPGRLAALEAACCHAGRGRTAVTVSAWGRQAPPGVDEWVVPDAALGPERHGWPEVLAAIRAATTPARD